jgi:hypothetical protein
MWVLFFQGTKPALRPLPVATAPLLSTKCEGGPATSPHPQRVTTSCQASASRSVTRLAGLPQCAFGVAYRMLARELNCLELLTRVAFDSAWYVRANSSRNRGTATGAPRRPSRPRTPGAQDRLNLPGPETDNGQQARREKKDQPKVSFWSMAACSTTRRSARVR